MRLRYGIGAGRKYNLADVAKRYGLSAERIRQIERDSINRLHAFAKSEDGMPQVPTAEVRSVPVQKEKPPKRINMAPQLGKRALRRYETEQKLIQYEPHLNEENARVLRAFAVSDTQEIAAEKLGISLATFAKRLRLAEQALKELID